MQTPWIAIRLKLSWLLVSALCIGCGFNPLDEAANNPTVAQAYASAQIMPMALPDLPKQTIQSDPWTQRLNQQFPMLPNPTRILYVFGYYQKGIPIAGHFMPFSLYTTTHYALPHEVLVPFPHTPVLGSSHD